MVHHRGHVLHMCLFRCMSCLPLDVWLYKQSRQVAPRKECIFEEMNLAYLSGYFLLECEATKSTRSNVNLKDMAYLGEPVSGIIPPEQ